MQSTTGNMKMEYMPSIEDHVKLAQAMGDAIRTWRTWCSGRGLINLWKRKLQNYYGLSEVGNNSQNIIAGGSEGELSFIKINDLRNLVQNQLQIVTGQRPAGIARASKPDTKCLRAARIGTVIAEYYMSRADLGFESKFVYGCEMALLLDEAWLELFWDKTLGRIVATDPETGQTERAGDCILRVHPIYNVARDPGTLIDNQKWNIISLRVNKFDSAATFPKFRDKIIVGEKDNLPEIPMNLLPDGSDSIWAHLLIADRTPACPNGRYALMISDQIVMDVEEGLPFSDYPLEKITSSEVLEGCTGYANSNDIMAMEQVTDALNSVVVTNQVTFGGQCLVGPDGNNIKQSDFGKGVRFFELPPDMVDKLKALDLLHTPPEIFNYIKVLDDKKAQQVGVNSVVRGQPEGQLAGASGTALALIQAQAIAFNSGSQRGYFKCLSNTMTKLLKILRRYQDTETTAEIVGKLKAESINKAFSYTGNDLENISSIVYELVNPIFQTLGGRLDLAKDLLREGQIKSPKQYLNLALTGQMDALVDDDEKDQLLILEENEALIEGRPVPAVITEMHADHIRSHNSLITQEAKEKDPEFVARVEDHVQEHIYLWFTASQINPALLIATNQQVLPVGQLPPMQKPEKTARGGLKGAEPRQIAAPPEESALNPGGEEALPGLPNVAGTEQEPVIPGVTQ